MAKGKGKNSFVVPYDWEGIFTSLGAEKAGQLLFAVFALEKRGEEYAGADPAISMAMRFIKNSLDYNREKYQERCERNRKNGQKGGRPNNPVGSEKPSGFSENPKNPLGADTDTESDSDNNAAALLNSAAAAENDDSGNAYAYYADHFSSRISREAAEMIPLYASEMGDGVVKLAIDEAINNNAHSWYYVKSILMTWHAEGIRSVDAAKRHLQKRQKGAGRNANGNGTAAKGKRHLPGETVL